MKYRSRKHAEKVRHRACKYAATVLSTWKEGGQNMAQMAFSLAVFFEMYMLDGANATAKDFGPKKPAKLKAVKKDIAS